MCSASCPIPILLFFYNPYIPHLLIQIIGLSDFEPIMPVSVSNQAEIHLFTIDDTITLEYYDRVQITFSPSNDSLISDLDAEGEYIRHTTIVYIIDNDSKFFF